MDESIAIQRLRQGDASGLEYLVEKYQARSLQTAWLVLRDQALAEDAVCQAFLKAFQSIRQFRQGSPFGPWFYRIVVNQALDLYRSESRFTGLDNLAPSYLQAPAPSLEAELAKAETVTELYDAMGRLPAEHRAALVLRYFVGLDDKATAQRLDKPLSTIKWWLRSARKQLRVALAPSEPEFRKELKDERK